MPFGSSKAAILGAAGAGGFDMEGGSRTTSGGYNFQTYTSSGTVTVVGEGTVDLILVGGGGGAYGTNAYTGGGGGGEDFFFLFFFFPPKLKKDVLLLPLLLPLLPSIILFVVDIFFKII